MCVRVCVCEHGGMHQTNIKFLIPNFRLVLNVVFFLLGDFLASEFYMPTFRNTLFHLHSRCKQEEQPG